MKKSSLKCPVCAGNFDYRVKRNWILRYIFFFIPVKIYCCGECKKNVYIVVKDLKLPGTNIS